MEAAKTLSKISQDRWRWIMQGRIEGEKRDYITGINAAKRAAREEGREEGAKATAIANAKNALAMGLSPEQASQITALSLEQVLALKEELNREPATAK
jgi:predicted transposase YdaD